jgi:flagellar basal body rod protein FlgG
MAATGLPVLGAGGGPINLPPGSSPEVSADGTIRQDGQVIGRLALVDVPDRRTLKKVEGGLFDPGPGARPLAASGTIAAGYVESAAVDEIAAMMAVAGASRAVQTNLAMISYHDQMMEQAVRTLGRVG